MAEAITMPPMGQTTGILKILRWHKQEGEEVKQGETLLEVETDKSTVDVESYASGVLLKILCNEGEEAEVGTIIAYVGEAGERFEVAVEKTVREQPVHEKSAEIMTARRGEAGKKTKVLASPLARRLAKDHHVDISEIEGSGPGRRIEKKDVLKFVELVKAKKTSGQVSRHRRVIAQSVIQSFRNIPHIYLTVRIDMTEVKKLVCELNAEEKKITYTHVFLRAAAEALREYGRLNRVWQDEGEIKEIERTNIGLAVAGEESLIVVTIPEPDRRSISELARYTMEAVKRARQGHLNQEDLSEAAVTVSNLGMYGVDQFSAIIGQRQTAVLAFGCIKEDPVVKEGEILISPIVNVTLSADHRVVDGVDGARYLNFLKTELEQIKIDGG